MESIYTISGVLIQEADGRWSAQCLEYDIAAQAKTVHEVRYEVEKALIGHFIVSTELGIEPFASLGPAPQRYWEMFQNAKEKLVGERYSFRVLGKVVPPIQPELRVAELESA